MYRLSTDVGGTFTDGILLDETTGAIKVSKVSSTPKNPAIGTIQCAERFEIPLSEVSFLVHGTTVVINALLEGKGAKTALITTKGFRDVLEIGRSNRTEMYNALYKKPTPLVPRYLRLEVRERMGSDSKVLIPLEIGDLAQIIEQMRKKEVESIAVCLINAYANPKHEQEIGRLLDERYPEATVSLSHNITRRYYEYERTSTTVQNAYVMPVVQKYVRCLEEELKKRRFQSVLQIMQSNGGIMKSAVAREMPISMVESGPVAGAIGGAQLASMIGYNNVITYDMGGTTAKASIIREGLPETADQYLVEGRPILLPVVDIREIGAGGGSIAWIDEAGALHVGPQSVGAELKAALTIDSMVERGVIRPPNLIKIDTDGIEIPITRGMERLLRSAQRPRCLLIEIQEGEYEPQVEFMTSCGYIVQEKHPVGKWKRKLEQGASLNEIAFNALFAPIT